MADKMSLKDGRPHVTILWTLAKLYIIPGLEPEGLKSIYCLNGDFFFVSKIFQNMLFYFPYGQGDLKLCHGLYELFETLTCHL